MANDVRPVDAKGKAADILFCESISDELGDLSNLPTIDPKTLRPVAHWEEIPGSYEVCAGKNGSWCVPATRQSVWPQNAVLSDVRIQNGGRAV